MFLMLSVVRLVRASLAWISYRDKRSKTRRVMLLSGMTVSKTAMPQKTLFPRYRNNKVVYKAICKGPSHIVWICIAADSIVVASDCIKFNTPPDPKTPLLLPRPRLRLLLSLVSFGNSLGLALLSSFVAKTLAPPPGRRRLLSKTNPSIAPRVWVDMLTTL